VVSETRSVLPDTAGLVSTPSRKRFYPLFASAKGRGRTSGTRREGVGQRLKISHVRIRLFVLDDLVRGMLCEMRNGNGHLRWRSRIELEVFRTKNVRRQLGPIYRVFPRAKGAVGIERGGRVVRRVVECRNITCIKVKEAMADAQRRRAFWGPREN